MQLDADDVAAWIAEGEGTRVEFKSGLPRPRKVARTLAAFANTKGGAFLVGVDDRGAVLGAPRPTESAEQLAAIAATEIEPPLHVHVRVVQVEDLPVVAAFVGLSDARPHTVERDGADGERETPIRLGSSTRAAEGAALRAIRGQRPGAGRGGLDALERRILEWVERQGDGGTSAQGVCTVQAFAASANIGAARARRAFVKLERAGRLFGHGRGSRRSYALP